MAFYNRQAQPSSKQAKTSQTAIFGAPTRGWVRNENLVYSRGPGGAELLENMFPTAEGARMRKGSTKHGTVDDDITHLANYHAGATQKLFGFTADGIFDITTPADPDVAPAADVSGQTSGDYSTPQVTTAGGTFMLAFNGTDLHQVYNGSAWAQNSPAITGVSSADISYAWLWKSFLWMIEGGTMDAWYLAAGAIGGAATVFPLGGVFKLGGELLFGATWSQDSGSGLDDYIIFVTTEGEVAVYQGTNPGSAADFALVGVYTIGRPLGKNAHCRFGGDLFIATDDAIIAASKIVSAERTGLIQSAITYPIEEAWRLIVQERKGTNFPFTMVIWPSETMLVVGVPTFGSLQKICLVMNSRTGAWAGPWTGWDTRSVVVHDDELYFGGASGAVYQGDISGSDDGDPYTATWLPRFDTLGSAAEKVAVHARLMARANVPFTPLLFANADYEISLPTAPNADAALSGNTWGSGIWDTSTWGSVSYYKSKRSRWQGVAAVGHALTSGMRVTSGRDTAPDFEVIAIYMQWEPGEVMG
jgi:hypothetical protein